MKKSKVAEKHTTIEQLYELMLHMQAGRITRADIQDLIQTASRRELQNMRNDCIGKAFELACGIKPPEHVQEKIARGEGISGYNHYVEGATYRQVRILTSLSVVAGESWLVDFACSSLDIVRPHLHPYEEAMIRLRIAEVTKSDKDYSVIVNLAFRGPDGFAKRVTILCDLALISSQSKYLDMAKKEKGMLTISSSHFAEADRAITYAEEMLRYSPSATNEWDDLFFHKFTSYLLQSNEAVSRVEWTKITDLISNKQRLEQEYARCWEAEWGDPVILQIRLTRVAMAHVVGGDILRTRKILNSHRFDPRYRDQIENFIAKAARKNRRLAGSFMAAVNITDPYLKADAFIVIAREINTRLKR
ncbi:MAG: hypothetical protein Q8P86_03330 [bacterium]|nr:hypothetical protein [bacterium]